MRSVKNSKLWIILVVISLTLMSCSLPSAITQLIDRSSSATTEPTAEAVGDVANDAGSVDNPNDVSTATYVIPDEVFTAGCPGELISKRQPRSGFNSGNHQ